MLEYKRYKKGSETMGKVIAVTNQKGGVGKTTTSVNVSSALVILGYKVLLIDIDPQGNATQGVGVDKAQLNHCVYDVIVKDVDIQEVIVKSVLEGLDVVPATIDLAGADLELVKHKTHREGRLKEKLDTIKDNYDFIIIDCPPSLGLLNTNALAAANAVMIPVQCEYYALEGLTQLLSTVRLAQRLFNPKLTIEGVVLTMMDSRTRLGIEISQEVRKYFKDKVYDTIIPRNIKLSEAPSVGLPILIYDPVCAGTSAYMELAKEVVKQNGKNQ